MKLFLIRITLALTVIFSPYLYADSESEIGKSVAELKQLADQGIAKDQYFNLSNSLK